MSRTVAGASQASTALAQANRAIRLYARGGVPVVTRLNAALSGQGSTSSASGLSDGSAQQQMTRLKVAVTADCSDLRVMVGNYSYGAVGPNAIYVTAAIETATPAVSYGAPFNGLKEVKLDPDGVALSDPVSIPVKKGDTLYLRTFVRVATLGEKWPLAVQYWQTGDAVTADTDLTANTSTTGLATPLISATGNSYGFAPVAVFGMTDAVVPVVALWGDSITVGVGNDPLDTQTSWAEYALNGTVPFLNLSRHNENGGSMVSIPANGLVAYTPVAYRHRMRLAQGCTHAVSSYGANDFAVSTMTAAVMQANYLAHWTALAGRGLKVRQTTLIPRGTSSDNFMTTANQTPHANEAVRIAVNTWLRDGAPILAGVAVAAGSSAAGTLRAGQSSHPLVGIIETADTVESARDSGRWRAPTLTVSDGAMTNASKTLTCATSAPFVTSHVGRRVVVAGAGAAGIALPSVIKTFTSATTVTLQNAASTTVSGATTGIGVYTGDGIHPSRTGHLAMSAALDPTLFAV